ncbi:F-box/LRR-repeat protein 2 [Naviculisporaceae sp. PSN 640]
MADSDVPVTIPSGPSTPAASDASITVNSTIENEGGMNLKKGSRHRLLRGLQRMASSPSLAHVGRQRSASSPYSVHSTLSCVSLASSPSPFGQPSPGSYFSQSSNAPSTAPTSVPGSPAAELPGFDGIESILAVRKIEHPILPSTTISLPTEVKKKATTINMWAKMPHEIKIHVLSFLLPKELVRISRVSKDFHTLCFDGQLWTSFDASEFYKDIPAESVAKIITAAGPFVKDLNLRGCVQVEHYKRAEVLAKACRNLINATLEGCRNFQRTTLHNLLRSNEKLTTLNLTGLTAVTNATCKIIAQSCPQLEMFNVSWCKHMDARGVKTVLEGCPKLKDLRAGEIKGFESSEVADALFKTNNLERLVLAGCDDLTDNALQIMVRGFEPEIDVLTDRPMVPPRKLRHLDLSRCNRLSSNGVKALGYLVPDLEGLQLSGITSITDAALEPIFASTPRLTLLELEDLAELTNSLLSEHLAKAPCAPNLEHLSISYCENLGDTGMLPVFRNCTKLKSVFVDNTKISDLVLAEAAAMVRERATSKTTTQKGVKPVVGLNLVVYDCMNVTWTGVREVLSRNAEIAGRTSRPIASAANPNIFPSAEIIFLKCFYGWQMTVDEHTKRVLAGDVGAANRLEKKWGLYMQANEEAGVGGANGRRRRRRAREAAQAHADEEDGDGANGGGVFMGRRRARTAACAVM